MKPKRRLLLKTGAAALLVSGVGGAWWGATRTSRTAGEPWRIAAEGFGDPRLDALAYAILAPNPHNMQPWQVRLHGDPAFSVYCDPARLLPETDPTNRQITIGFGCFLELVRQAAAESGYRADIEYFPEGVPDAQLDSRPIAAVSLAADESISPDALFAQTLVRRTNRRSFDIDRAVPDDALAAIRAATVFGVGARTSAEAGLVETLRQLTVAAWDVEWSTPATRRESIAVTRFGKAEVSAAPWGLTLDGALNSTLTTIGVMSASDMDDPTTVTFRESYRFYERCCRTAMAYVWSTTEANTRIDQLEAGRAWVRMQQAATANGVAFHPLSQALQEFPAMATHYRRAHELLTTGDGETVQMLSRLGYAPSPVAAPREPLESKLVLA